MGKKFAVIAFAVFGFGWISGANAGTDVIADYKNPAPSYNYSYVSPPPPRPIYYTPAVNVLVFPAYGYCGPRFVGPRFVGRRVYARHHH